MADVRTRLPQAAACTVISERRLPVARALARSYLDHHPGGDFVVLVVDRPEYAGEAADHRVIGYRGLDIDQDEFLRLATCLSESELVRAAIPVLLKTLLADVDVAMYLAPETEVLAPLTDVARLGVEHGITLVPQMLAPLPQDGKEPGEQSHAFDDGFLAVGSTARPFLDFWRKRSVRADPDERGRILELVPGLFPHTVVRDPGFGAAYWNLHERPLSRRSDGTVEAAGSPLRFLHLPGYRPEKPWQLTDHCRTPRFRLSHNRTLRELCAGYADRLRAAGYRETAESPAADTTPDQSTEDYEYGFARLSDGTPLTDQMRRLFRNEWLDAIDARADDPLERGAAELPPHPFGDDGAAAFRRWLAAPTSPTERSAGLNRLTMWVWAHRPDLQTAFPKPLHGSSEGFRQWCRTHGFAEGLLPEWALPREPATPSGPVDEFGVNIAGYHTAELGIGEMGRVIIRAVQESGVPIVSVVEEHSLSRTVRTKLDAPDTVGRPKFPVSIITVNADYTELLLDSHPEVGHERYRIGLWAWELEDFPEHLHAGFDLVDEVWTVSEFCARAIAPHSPVPVKVVPVPVLDPGEKPRPVRAEDEPVRFLFAFDFNSTGQRKNPWGVVEAFRRAFGDRDDVRLTIKATNGHLHAEAEERLRYVIGDDDRIELLDRYLSVAELDALYADNDAYVSLHRSEGFGLTVAEAMVRGMPVIATAYGGTTEFFDTAVGWRIPYERAEVGPGWKPYQADGVWADPDLDAAAEAMRQVADDPAEARRRGKAAREHILRTRSMDAATEWIRTELRAAYETWRARQEPPPDPFAPTLRKLVGRVLPQRDERTLSGRLTNRARGTLSALGRRAETVTRLTRQSRLTRQDHRARAHRTDRDEQGH
ncbi:glycosyltransferase [Saccharomonospora sp.]|uniref:glycosyltransferase family 4 protein n=1 Tax=Saccharomonospora sp. TaxID=33913 RepID=UPI002616B293|nr:glycosyltransferase [Saccharomonospora sp.]